MKAKLLFTVLFTSSLIGFSQVLDSDNFDSLTIGNFPNGTAQSGLLVTGNNGEDPTTTTNVSASSVQVVASGNNGTQGAQITSPNGDKGIVFLYKPIETEWASRTAGNDIVQLEFTFFTGAATTSTASFRATIFGLNGAEGGPLASLNFDPVTNELSGLATLNVNGASGLYVFNLGASNTDLILPANTWLEMGCSYNTITGEIRWQSDFNNTNLFFNNTDNVIVGMVPTEVDFLSIGNDTNATATNYVIDDYKLSASDTNTLSNDISDLEFESTNITLFPNPANNSITLKTNLSLKEVTVFNTLGQIVLSKKDNFSKTNALDISSFNAGFYVMSIKSSDGNTQTRKFLKN